MPVFFGSPAVRVPLTEIKSLPGFSAKLGSMTDFAAKVLIPLLAAGIAAPTIAAPAPAPKRAAEILNMVRQDCGSCHGLTLKGGLGPALLPSTLRDKEPLSLKSTILYGRPGTPMPPWKPFLSDAEAEWVVEQLVKGLPDGR